MEDIRSDSQSRHPAVKHDVTMAVFGMALVADETDVLALAHEVADKRIEVPEDVVVLLEMLSIGGKYLAMRLGATADGLRVARELRVHVLDAPLGEARREITLGELATVAPRGLSDVDHDIDVGPFEKVEELGETSLLVADRRDLSDIHEARRRWR